MNLKQVPVVIIDNLTEEQVKAYRIADNKTAEYSEWDYEKLIQEIQELSEANYDLELTGFAEGRDYYITVDDIENIEIDSHDNSTV